MTGFFDPTPTPGSNRHAPDNGCPTCGGDRLVPVDQHDRDLGYAEVYGPCPACSPARTAAREPVAEDAWWKQ